MSATAGIIITCDACQRRVFAVGASVAVARMNAEREGWSAHPDDVFIGNASADYCPAHRVIDAEPLTTPAATP